MSEKNSYERKMEKDYRFLNKVFEKKLDEMSFGIGWFMGLTYSLYLMEKQNGDKKSFKKIKKHLEQTEKNTKIVFKGRRKK